MLPVFKMWFFIMHCILTFNYTVRMPVFCCAKSYVLKSYIGNTLCDPQTVVLILAVLGVRFMYLCKVPRDSGRILYVKEIKID